LRLLAASSHHQAVMPELPSGTVTFLFTDVEGSTRLLADRGDAYAGLLAEHRSILRAVLSRRRGVEVDTQGDAFFFAFAKASDAVAAAREAQEALASGPIRVRIGLHTGEPQLTSEGYVGMAVHAGARIAAAGHGGQILLSSRTKELAGDDVTVTDLGEHRLKDLNDPVRLYQIGPAVFPPLRAMNVTNLPRPATSFIGRQSELEDAAALLVRSRLLTITGAGGSGKTRFAIELARSVLASFPDGVFWVQLAQLRDPLLVLGMAQQALGAVTEFARHVADKRMLVLFDNFEQVVQAATQLPPILATCQNLSIIVTSRELLRVQGEHEFALPPLTEDEAMALFCERAGEPSSDSVRELSRRLDGLPLAIELAAARARLFSPDQLMHRLSNHLDLLKGGRDADPRQVTLRAKFGWSYDLLSPAEKTLLGRLAIFVGGCTYDAAEEVADAELDVLESLLDKSLIRRTDDRIWMLETIREYAAERLEQSGDAASVASRHASYFLAITQAANLDQFSEAPGSAPTVLFVEQSNIRAALDRTLELGEAELGLGLASAVGIFWILLDPMEGLRWFRSFLELDADVPVEVRAQALRVYGGIANHAGEDELAERLYQQALGEYQRLGDELGIAVVDIHLAHNAWYRGDAETARALGRAALDAGRRLNHRKVEAQALGLLGDLEFERGAPDLGLELLETSAASANEAGVTWWQARMYLRLAKRSRELGRRVEARRWGLDCLRLSASMPDHRRIVQALDVLAIIAADEGNLESAGLIRGAVDAEAMRNPVTAWTVSDLPPGVETDPGFTRSREDGERLSLDDAVGKALEAWG
jgi:predicted ATPase/class 3 adenylate cyclase